MAVVGKVIERDTGFNRIRDTFIKAGSPIVKVGIQGTEANADHGGFKEPLTNLDLGVIHEFGAPGANIPERSFIRAPAKMNAGKYFRTIKVITKAAIAGIMSVEKGLGLLGIQVEADMKAAFDKGLKPPLKRRRKVPRGAGKGGQKPLLDTGQLRNSITHVVTKKRGFFG